MVNGQLLVVSSRQNEVPWGEWHLCPEREKRSMKTELLTLGACSLLGKITYV